MKKVAVITPVFNGETYLKNCLESVALSNTDSFFELEHIVVDDCSTDNSWNIIQESKLDNLRAIRLEKNQGSSNARNVAIQQTDADFIFCLDQDDVIFQNSLKSLYVHAHKQNTDWVYGDFLRTDETLSYRMGDDYYGSQFDSASNLLTSIFLGEHFFQQNSFYTKSLFESVGGFAKEIAVYQDLDLCIRFAIKGHRPTYLSGPLYIHRLHETNVSKVSGRENNLDAHKEDLKTIYRQYGDSLRSILDSTQLKIVEDFLKSS
ncbi:MAG: glycosyltransferase [Patescibacteria group bacterium]